MLALLCRLVWRVWEINFVPQVFPELNLFPLITLSLVNLESAISPTPLDGFSSNFVHMLVLLFRFAWRQMNVVLQVVTELWLLITLNYLNLVRATYVIAVAYNVPSLALLFLIVRLKKLHFSLNLVEFWHKWGRTDEAIIVELG